MIQKTGNSVSGVFYKIFNLKRLISGLSMAACGEVVSNLGKNELIFPTVISALCVFSKVFHLSDFESPPGYLRCVITVFGLKPQRKSGIWGGIRA